jgi:hypothetical protein
MLYKQISVMSVILVVPNHLYTETIKRRTEMAYQATCMKATCRYTETYQVNPGAKKCPKCGTMMMAKKS